MQPNYEELMKRQQQDYQRSRDPFQYGQQVAQRRYSEIMSELDARRQATQQSYGDLYSAARQRAVRGQAAGGPTLSGGMGQQQRDFVSAIEMQELGRIGQAREGAIRDLYSQGQAAFSNAQLEGQQATQMELQNQQTQLQLTQQRQAILADDKLTDAQRAEQLSALGVSPTEVPQEKTSFGQFFGQALTAGGAVITLGSIASGVAASFAVSSAPLTAAIATGKTAAVFAALGKAGVSGFLGKGIAAAVMAHPYIAAGLAVLAVGGLIYAGIRSATQD